MVEGTMKMIEIAVKAELGTECEVFFQKVRKNNGVEDQAIVIREPGTNISPMIYIDSFLERIAACEIGIGEAALAIVQIYRQSCGNESVLGIVKNLSRKDILENVVYQVIGKESNSELLLRLPYKEFLDLAAVYRVIINMDDSWVSSFEVSLRLCDRYEISLEELDAAAMANTREKIIVQTMDSLLEEICGGMEDEKLGFPLMLVVTNMNKRYGAAALLCADVFEKLSNELGCDLYVLPSSIHEVIAVPTYGAEAGCLRDMVTDINASYVDTHEVLSNSVYRYSRITGRFDIA